MKKRISYQHEFTRLDGTEVTLEARYEPSDCHDVLCKEVGDVIVMGYLEHDAHCENPFENDEYLGVIHHHPSSRYGVRKDTGYYDALACDRDGNPIIDEDALQKAWHDAVTSIPLHTFTLPSNLAWEKHEQVLREQLADESVADIRTSAQCEYAWRQHDLPDDLMETLGDRVESVINWNYDSAVEDCSEPGNPDAVLLDLYEHSGCVWSISGTGANCRWDTSRGESVWVPDKYTLEEVARRAPVYDHAYIESTSWIRGTGKSYLLHFGDKDGEFSDDWMALWAKAVEIAVANVGEPPRFKGRERALLEMAENAVRQYNAWTNGDCYGFVIQVHDKAGVFSEEDVCWGLIGSDFAEETLKSEFEDTVEQHTALSTEVA